MALNCNSTTYSSAINQIEILYNVLCSTASHSMCMYVMFTRDYSERICCANTNELLFYSFKMGTGFNIGEKGKLEWLGEGTASRCININIWSHMQTSRRLSDSRNPGFIWNNSINYWLMALLHARMMMRCWWGGWLRHWRRPRIEISNRCVFVTCFWKHFLLSFGFRTKRHNQTENQLIEITFYSFSKSILFHEIINLIIYSIHNRSVFIENM